MIVGSCYELSQVNGQWQYDCSLNIKNQCPGYWVEPLDDDNSFCTSSYRPPDPIMSGSYIFPQSMSATAFASYGLTPGDEFQGGVYIGTFNPTPLDSSSSKVRCNIYFEEPTYGNFASDSIGGTPTKWAVIVDFNLYTVSFLQSGERDSSPNTSLWDGYYNTYGNNDTFNGVDTVLAKTLQIVPRKGFIDYYLPSVYELGFLAQYLYENSITINANLISSSIFSTRYINSTTNKTNINGNSFVYGQTMKSGSDQYRNALINKYNTHSALFFRRIVLT